MKVLGVDAGKHLGHSTLELVDQRWSRLAGGVVAVSEQLMPFIQAAALVVIEEPSQIMPSKRLERAGHRVAIGMGNQLLRAKEVGRDVERLALRAGVAVIVMTSSEARRAIGIRIGGRGATKGGVDRQVAVAVPRIVSGWPGRSRNHERDAAVAAIAGYARWQAEQALQGRAERMAVR